MEAVAGAILDGAPIDWDAVDSAAAPPDRPVLRHMKAIAAIAAAQSTDMPDTWGPLRLLERIGRGAFGDVYRAWDPRLDREVALKLMPDDRASSDQLATSIIEEGRLLARIRHPNVVTIYGAERIGRRIGLWMEFVRGRTLKQIVDDGRVFSGAEAIEIGVELCRAVAAVTARACSIATSRHRTMLADNGRPVRWILAPDASSRTIPPLIWPERPSIWRLRFWVGGRPPSRATSTVSASCSTTLSPARIQSVREP
jgi:hypothetical protein